MPIIKCKMCGGDIQLAADKTFGTCEYCGSTMTFPKVSDEQRAAAFNRGNHFRRVGEFDKALSVYEHIVADDDADAEAHWCCALCRFGIEYVEDPATYEWLPTCHRASFDSFLEDVDYLAAVEHSDGITRRQYQKDAAKIAEVQRGILATSRSTEPYDVFISYKELDDNGERTRDSILAQEIYYRLTEKGWRVFFSRISLEDVPGTQYEPYIFAALNSAKVMIVVGTSAENLNAVWVKNEWSRFLAMMRKDRTKLLIPCYRDMDPYDLPEQLSVLMSYDMGKIGFIQDLIRGVDKVLTAEKKEHETVKETVKETVVVQGGEAPAKTAAAVKRGNLALEDGEWDKAKEYFEQALTLDAENAEAYLGLALADEKCTDMNVYINRACGRTGESELLTLPAATERITSTVRSNVLKNYLAEDALRSLFDYDLRYPSALAAQKRIAEEERARFQKNRNLSRAFRFAKGETAERLNTFKARLFNGLDRKAEDAGEQAETARREKAAAYEEHLKAAEEKAAVLRREAEERREVDYLAACEAQEKAESVENFRAAIDDFKKFADHKDSAERIKECEAAVHDMEEQERRRREAEIRAAKEKAEAWRKSKEDKAKAAAEEQARKDKAKKKKIGILAGVVAAAVVAGVLFYTTAIAPGKGNNNDQAYRLTISQTAQRATIAAGSYHTVGINEDGTVVAVGDDSQGQCDVAGWTSIVAVAAGDKHTIGLKSDGTVVGTGRNQDGQCEVSDWTDIVAVAAGDSHTVGLRKNGTVITAGSNNYQQCDVSDWTGIVAVAAGAYHTVGLHADGTVVAVGKTDGGQCNVSSWTSIIAVSAGDYHTVGLRADGTVAASGRNNAGQSAVSEWTEIMSVTAGAQHTVGLRTDGTVIAVGLSNSGQKNTSKWEHIVAVTAGGKHSVGLCGDGTVVAVGSNKYGQCNVSGWKKIMLPNTKFRETAESMEESAVIPERQLNLPKNVAVGDTVFFGAYEQDNNSTNGKEDIEWLVLAKEGDQILAVSKYALDCQPYNTEKKSVSWAECSLRKWLNNSFLNNAFNEAEKAVLSMPSGSEDQVYLLSAEQANNYFKSNQMVRCVPTKYAIAQGVSQSEKITVDGDPICSWWIRSANDSSSASANAYYSMAYTVYGFDVNYAKNAVRPAIWINLAK